MKTTKCRTITSWIEENLSNRYYHLWSVSKRDKEKSHKIQKILALSHLKHCYISPFELAGPIEAQEMMDYCVKKYGHGEDFELEEIERTI